LLISLSVNQVSSATPLVPASPDNVAGSSLATPAS
jgi:hypothetical protein